ncbi:MAG: FliA/WhiG family RNA polymerase sigma factor [Nitrospirae bacterium]|nr:MAG: FliA/WhiG family RNA polymerase sigma factor [Nitrospirota bacterium]
MAQKDSTASIDETAAETASGIAGDGHDRLTGKPSTSEIVREYLPLIRRIALTVLSKSRCCLEVEDLVSAGVVGLLSALARYDSGRAVKFRTFAEYRIRGMMLDEIRAMDWIPRSVRTRQEQIFKTASILTCHNGHPPSRTEIAECLGIPQEEVEEAMAMLVPIVSLDEPVAEDDGLATLKDVIPDTEHRDPFAASVSMEISQVLNAALRQLTKKQQRVMRLYYFHGWSMKEIGRDLNITESGVCRIHAQALRRLHLVLAEQYAEYAPPNEGSVVERTEASAHLGSSSSTHTMPKPPDWVRKEMRETLI